ncbi:MAG: CarD family transcriptional regulator [Atopobiaceae bacterium]|nr:CarD family transcriptional regulator [Atopobiaceae bacterium]
MFDIGEYVVHPGQGVCKIDRIDSEPAEVYVLLPVGDRHSTHISFPVASQGRLRPILSEKEAQSLIDLWPEMATDPYTDRSLALEEEHFKKQIRLGTCEDCVRVVKTFMERIEQAQSINKKPPVAYERILKEARSRSLTELSVALGTTVEDVRSRFEGIDRVVPAEEA